ncbi:MAG TPA: hypothetical protein VKB19_15365 [Pedobacter sp.]|nr:hypothetical protein [Pedobacter sp.]
MKTALSLLSLILLFAACGEPKMRLKAPEAAKEENNMAVENSNDSVQKDSALLSIKN